MFNGAANVTGDGTAYTPIFDGGTAGSQGTGFNYGTSTFTSPVDGFYLITFQITLSGLTSGHTSGVLQLLATGSQFPWARVFSPFNMSDGSNICSVNIQAIMKLTAGSTVTPVVVVSGSTKTVSTLGAGGGNGFSYFHYAKLF